MYALNISARLTHFTVWATNFKLKEKRERGMAQDMLDCLEHAKGNVFGERRRRVSSFADRPGKK